jgi:hypothetical protein
MCLSCFDPFNQTCTTKKEKCPTHTWHTGTTVRAKEKYKIHVLSAGLATSCYILETSFMRKNGLDARSILFKKITSCRVVLFFQSMRVQKQDWRACTKHGYMLLFSSFPFRRVSCCRFVLPYFFLPVVVDLGSCFSMKKSAAVVG